MTGMAVMRRDALIAADALIIFIFADGDRLRIPPRMQFLFAACCGQLFPSGR
jgi:hypothetical protein